MKTLHLYLAVAFAAVTGPIYGANPFRGHMYSPALFRQVTDVNTVFRAQSGGVPLPSDPGGMSSGSIDSTGSVPGSAVPAAPILSQPPATYGAQTYPDSTWNAFSPPITSDPFATGPAGGQPYAPYTPYGSGASSYGGSPQPFSTFGANGPAPFRQGWQNRLEVEYLPGRSVSSPSSAGTFEQFGVNYDLGYSGSLLPGWVMTWTNEFRLRNWSGPQGGPGLPGKAFRLGWDFEMASTQSGPVSLKLGITPSINSDFESSIGSAAFQLDGRGMFIFQLDQYWSMVLGAGYWDRVNDRVVPYAGLVYRDDFWEWRLMYPETTVSLFLGNEPNWAKWMYFRAEHHIEAYDVSTAGGGNDQAELEDWRAAFGFRMDGGTYSWFIEAGWVFDRNVEFMSSPAGQFSPGTGFITSVGWKY